MQPKGSDSPSGAGAGARASVGPPQAVRPASFFAPICHDLRQAAAPPSAQAAAAKPSDEDEGLLAAIADGQAAALQSIYDRHADALWRLALLLAGTSKRAERAVQGAFLALWRNPEAARRTQRSLRCVLAGEVYTRCTEPAAATERPAAGRRRGALAGLSGEQRDLMALIVFGEHTLVQAAGAMGLSQPAARATVAAALRTTARVLSASHRRAPLLLVRRAPVRWRRRLAS